MMENNIYLTLFGRKMSGYLNHRTNFYFKSPRFVVFRHSYSGNGISKIILKTDDLNYLKIWLDCNGYCLGKLESGIVDKEHGYSQRRYALVMKS